MEDYKLNGRIWLTLNDEMVLGEGKIRLLNRISELGSLRQAAEAMQMSYRKAWYSVKQINEAAKEPVVILKRGGTDGGHAQITDYGKKLIQKFSQQKEDFKQFLEQQNSSNTSFLE